MKNLYSEDCSLELTAPATLTSGKMVVIGDLVGIAVADAASGAKFTLRRDAVITYKKKTADTFAEGDKVYYDSSNDELTSTSAGNKLVGRAVEVFGATAGDMKIILAEFAS